ncbi:putative RING finger protein YBR062C [Colletotrichum liriopes]|uniref:RING finger protein YBR062C n=1 Tax=Colletotrichum liriopes TaxID=708192 RepID=A0AA37LX95_9PEZI|nr:putative RING finger protein YBR062C [Colletotrichum liriopes]
MATQYEAAVPNPLLHGPNADNARFLSGLVEALERDIASPPTEIPGVSQEYLDSLDRVSKKASARRKRFLDDQYPLVVELPCHSSHRFDLECVSPWLRSKGSCPMCRKDLTKKKEQVVVPDDEEENDDPDGLYA